MFDYRAAPARSCPGCGKRMDYDRYSEKYLCYNCSASYSVEFLDKGLDDLEKQEDARWHVPCVEAGWGEEEKEMSSFSCPSCGAELIFHKTATVKSCPYCDNHAIISSRFKGSYRPDYILPFKLSSKDALAAWEKHCEKRLLMPRGFSSELELETIKAVYVPCWMYEVKAEAHQQFKAKKRLTVPGLFRKHIKTDYFDVYRSGRISFDRLYVDASEKMPDDYMASLEPFNYYEMKPFSTAYLPGFLAERFDVLPTESKEKVAQLCKDYAAKALKDSIKGYDDLELRNEAVSIRKGEVHYVLLPVYLISSKWKEKNYLFAVNGHSGKTVGKLPVDKKKEYGLFAAAFLPLAATFSLLLRHHALLLYGAILLSFLAAGFLCLHFLEKMDGGLVSRFRITVSSQKGVELMQELDEPTNSIWTKGPLRLPTPKTLLLVLFSLGGKNKNSSGKF